MEAEVSGLIERLFDLGQSAIVAIFAGISGAIIWIFRNVFTIKQELDLTRQKLDSLEKGLSRIEDLLIQDGLRGRGK